jgi:amino acid transporter
MNKTIKNTTLFIFSLALLTTPCFVFASSSGMIENLMNVAVNSGYSETTDQTSVSAIAGTIVSAFLSLLGVIFVALIIYAGVTWMTAEGDEEKVKKAKKTMSNAIIGLILTVSATAIYYVVQKIFRGV